MPTSGQRSVRSIIEKSKTPCQELFLVFFLFVRLKIFFILFNKNKPSNLIETKSTSETSPDEIDCPINDFEEQT